MKEGTFMFSGEWMEKVKKLPETGMGYTVVSVILRDGRKFEQVAIVSGYLALIRGMPNIPFTEEDIVDITPNHRKWDWNKEQ